MALFPPGDNGPQSLYKIVGSLDGTELIEIANIGTTKLYAPLSAIRSLINSPVGGTFVLASPYTMTNTDTSIFVNLTTPGALSITMRSAAASGGGVFVKDLLGIAGIYNITLTASGTDSFEGNKSTFVIKTPFAGRKFIPIQERDLTWTWSVEY